jgi:PAS domain S-box-containing protein
MSSRRLASDPLVSTLVERLDAALWMVFPATGQIRYLSSGAERVLGFRIQELYEAPFLILQCIVPEDRERVMRVFSSGLSGGAPEPEVWFRVTRRSDQQVRWIRARGIWIRTIQGRVIAGGIAEDLTELRQSLGRSEVGLGSGSESLEQEFISLASHELKTPLAPLKLTLQTLARLVEQGGEMSPLRLVAGASEPGVDRVQRLLTIALAQVGRMEVLTNNLLDASQLQAGHFEVRRQETDLSKLLERLVECYRSWVESAGGRLALKVLPGVVGWFDELRIEQVFSNLISNAVKYAPGSLIEVELEQFDGIARLMIRDHGPGIPEGLMPELFDKFRRGDGVRKLAGFGLGLYICRRIAEAHGGAIRAENLADGGARFELSLPARERMARTGT